MSASTCRQLARSKEQRAQERERERERERKAKALTRTEIETELREKLAVSLWPIWKSTRTIATYNLRRGRKRRHPNYKRWAFKKGLLEVVATKTRV